MAKDLMFRGARPIRAEVNPILEKGEIGSDADDGVVKVGDGVHSWAQLPPALSSTYVTFKRSDTGAPITGGHITVKVDPTTHEIVDIVWEA